MAEVLPLDQQTYARLTLRRLWESLPLALLAGLLFSLFSLPAMLLLMLNLPAPAIIMGALTIGPAWAALLAQEAEILADTKTNIGVMARALWRYGSRSARLGLLAAIPLLAALWTLPNLAQDEVPGLIWLGLAADALGLLLLVTLYLYAFPLLVLYDLDLTTALRNALILASRYVMNSFGLLSLGGLFGLGALYLNSGLLFILPAVWGMFIVNNCRLVVSLEQADDDPAKNEVSE